MFAEIFFQIFGQIEQHGTWHGRVNGSDELEFVEEFAVVVASEDDSILCREEVFGILLNAWILSLHITKVDAYWKRGDDVREALDAKRSLVLELIKLDMPPERPHLIGNVGAHSLVLRRARNAFDGYGFDEFKEVAVGVFERQEVQITFGERRGPKASLRYTNKAL